MKKRKKQGSSTGVGGPADQTGWRRKLQASRVKFDDVQKRSYIEEFQKTGLKAHSAAKAGVCMSCIISHRKNDPEFAAMEARAYDIYRDSLAAEVDRRAREGWDEPVYQKGIRVIEPVLNEDGSQTVNDAGQPIFRYASVRRFSDRLMEIHIKRHDPAYRDRSMVDVNKTEAPPDHDFSRLSPEKREVLRAMLEEAAAEVQPKAPEQLH